LYKWYLPDQFKTFEQYDLFWCYRRINLQSFQNEARRRRKKILNQPSRNYQNCIRHEISFIFSGNILIVDSFCFLIWSEQLDTSKREGRNKNKQPPCSGSTFNDVRVELDLPGTMDQLAAILLDVKKYKEWSYGTKVSELVKQQGPNKLIYYTEIEVPWPATNRFFYANFELKEDPSAHTMQVIAVNMPDYGPVPKDLVQVPFTKGVWNISMISNKIIHVDYVLELNPGGSLPAWVLNLFSTKGPMESFENIKQKMTALNPS
jgi:START domain